MDKFSALAVCINTSRLYLHGQIITREELCGYSTLSNNNVISNLIKHHAIIKLGNNRYQFNNKPIHRSLIEQCFK